MELNHLCGGQGRKGTPFLAGGVSLFSASFTAALGLTPRRMLLYGGQDGRGVTLVTSLWCQG
jgi:hypothetical protein